VHDALPHFQVFKVFTCHVGPPVKQYREAAKLSFAVK